MSALDGVPEPVSGESVALLIELALNEFYRARSQSMRDWADRAASAAEALGDAPVMAAALAMPVLADAMAGAGERARSERAGAAVLVDSLSDDELSRRLDAAVWLAAAELYLSKKTVETHLRHIFHKTDVASRVALARAVERADQTASARPG